ncbi:MAG TPA: c-type cytochrome [Burkholderiaceae bacterium]|nr:c-type cytochrome [Burkholderiaceae bacterium]
MPIRRWSELPGPRPRAAALLLGLLPLGLQPTPPLSPQPSPPPRAELARGLAWLGQYQCGACHRIPGLPQAQGTLGPDLAGFGRRSYIAGEVPNRPALRRQWIMDPESLVPRTPMPALGVPAERAAAMAAYLGELR